MINRHLFKILLIFLAFMLFLGTKESVFATAPNEEMDSSFGSYVNELQEFVKNSEASDLINIDINKISNDLREGKGLRYDNIFEILLNIVFKQVLVMLSSSIVVIIFIIISSVIKSLAIDRQSEVIKLTNIVCFVSLSIIVISNFINMLEVLKSTVLVMSNIMQIVSPFLFGLLIINGAITSVGIIQPLILFLTSFTGYIISNVIVPLIVLSVIFSVIGSINDKGGIVKIGIFFRKLSLWIFGILLTVFIGVLSMETSITKDVDSLSIKTATAAVSNFVPVVGKFFSDSLETVVGASKIITKAGGIIGIIVIIVVALMPIIKLIVASLVYNLMSILSEIIDADSKMVKMLSDFSEVYKTMCGILIANSLMFIICTAIILNLSSSIVK